MTYKSITVAGLVAMVWTAIVAIYVLNGLGPHGYIDGDTDALWSTVGWLSAGGLVLGWVLRQFWFDSVRKQLPKAASRLATGGEDVLFDDGVRQDEFSEEHRYARGEWSIYDSDEMDFRR